MASIWPEVWSWTSVLQYLAIPITSALVGWGTNVLALRMTFYPLEFKGILLSWGKIGWQGIIPAKAGEMAGKAVDLLTKNLITLDDRFSQIYPARAAEEIRPLLSKILWDVISDSMEEQAPHLWKMTPDSLKRRIYFKALYKSPVVVEKLMAQVKMNIEDLFDIRGMIVSELEGDKNLLNQIFYKVGEKEFKFIELSGLYFGFIFGILQMLLWYFLQGKMYAYTILPLAGLGVGYFTNAFALRLIFEPIHPRKIGPLIIQGLFIKRQRSVSASYARMVATRILTATKIFEYMMYRESKHKVQQLLQHEISQTMQEIVGISGPLFQLSTNPGTFYRIQTVVSEKFMKKLPIIMKRMFPYLDEVLDIEYSLRTRMQNLPPQSFIGFLRPVFQEDEWKLILVGAILGFLAGCGQLLIIFGGRGL